MKNYALANITVNELMTEEQFLIAAAMLNEEERASFLAEMQQQQ